MHFAYDFDYFVYQADVKKLVLTSLVLIVLCTILMFLLLALHCTHKSHNLLIVYEENPMKMLVMTMQRIYVSFQTGLKSLSLVKKVYILCWKAVMCGCTLIFP